MPPDNQTGASKADQTKQEHQRHVKQSVIAGKGTNHAKAGYHRNHNILRNGDDTADMRCH